MGIHDRINPFIKVIQVTDLSQSQVIYESCTSDDASSVASEQPVVRPPRRIRTKAEGLDLQSLANRLHCKSRRFAKRSNHLSFVRALVGLEEAEIETEFDLTQENYGRSAFSSLFSETEKMKAWNAFVEMTEEDQQTLIDSQHSSGDDVTSSTDQLVSEFVNVQITEQGDVVENNNSSLDKRQVHPSYSSEACFKHVDPNIKAMLKKRHLPLGLLESVEQEMRTVFTESLFSVYEPVMETSFGRMLVHAVTQYLGLESISFECDGIRSMTVVNKKQRFNPPALLLYQYLEWKSGNQRYM